MAIKLEKLTLREMVENFPLYTGLPDGLIKLPVPHEIKIGRKKYGVPFGLSAFSKGLCYGQRIFLAQKEDNDFGAIVRVMDGYYYPIVTGKKWDQDEALLFGKKILSCTVQDLYPVAMHLISLVGELAEREKSLLYREPSKVEIAAGIEKLNVYAEMTAIDFLRDNMKITVPEVLLTPYNECLVRFMIEKEFSDFRERYAELLKDSLKNKHHE